MHYAGLLTAAAAAFAVCPAALLAQDGDAAAEGETDDEAARLVAVEAGELNVTTYTPADFARFSPTNALDMVIRVPGFTIRGADEQRGLGQATANVLIDGQRIASKSDGLFDRLRRIAATRVDRIEIVDGVTLGIPGLSGQVANVITRPGGVSGRFEYRANMRPRYARPSYVGGEVSLSGSATDLEWTLAANHGVGRGAAGGPGGLLLDPQLAVLERRDVRLRFTGEFPRLSGNLAYTLGEGSVLHLNASYSRRYNHFSDDEQRDSVLGVDSYRNFDTHDRGYQYELGGDLTLPLAGGNLKLVGLDRVNHNRGRADVVFSYADLSPNDGSRFTGLTDSSERIGRAEYSWDMLGGGWQLDGEGAFNRLDQVAALFVLNPMGGLDEVPFPDGSGGVSEDRYEVILSHNRTLAPGLNLQLGGGAEVSTLAQTGPAGLTRHFQRPKGSVQLAWTPETGRDLSLRLARTVGQLDFGDFLASVSLSQENGSAGNVELVPPQSWELEAELSESLGPWGSTHVKLFAHFTRDRFEFVPVAGGLETNGNVPHARIMGLDWSNTLELAPLGFHGARLTTNAQLNTSRLADPLTGERRPYSGQTDTHLDADLRHDVPGTQWAWGVGIEYNHVLPFYRPSEVSRDWEGPVYTSAFIEHKDVLGMTANLSVFNATNGRAKYYRSVYDGYRNSAPLLFVERRNLSVQPIVSFSLKGNF